MHKVSSLRRVVAVLAALAIVSSVAVASASPAAETTIVWTKRTATGTDPWRSVTYGNSIFVAVASNGSVMSSTDGINWTARVAAASNSWQSVTYGNSMFVAVASDGTNNQVMTSSDGINWTSQVTSGDYFWQSVTYGNSMFVAVAYGCYSGSGCDNLVMTSPDGVNWTSQPIPTLPYMWYSVTYGNSKFVAVALTGQVMTSPDGTNWTQQTSAASSGWRSVTYANSTFVAVASSGTDRVMTSPDGTTWTARSAAVNNSWNSVIFGSGRFVAVAWDGASRVMTSPDGSTWTSQPAAAQYGWSSVTYGGGIFVSVAAYVSEVMTGNPAAPPGAPTSLVATPNDGSVSIAFTPGSAGSSAISKYQYTTNDGTDWYDVSSGGTSSPSTITGLTNGTAYTIKLRAYNAAGGAGAESGAVGVTPLAVPSAPTSLVATIGNTSVSIAFAPGAAGTNAITKYQYTINDGTSWSDVSAGGTSSPVTITGLTNYTTYSIKLRAYSTAGGTASSAVSVQTKNASPTFTTAYSARMSGNPNRGIYVGFTGLTPPSGTMLNYRVNAYAQGTNTVISTCLVPATWRACFLTGLTAGTQYDLRVVGYLKLPATPLITRSTFESGTTTVRV